MWCTKLLNFKALLSISIALNSRPTLSKDRPLELHCQMMVSRLLSVASCPSCHAMQCHSCHDGLYVSYSLLSTGCVSSCLPQAIAEGTCPKWYGVAIISVHNPVDSTWLRYMACKTKERGADCNHCSAAIFRYKHLETDLQSFDWLHMSMPNRHDTIVATP